METKQTVKHKVLVVDDNSENIRIIGSILRENGFKVGFATNGKQALEILKDNEEGYDLVLLDVNMPGMNGFEVCISLRQNTFLKDLPVIFLTANAEPEHVMEGFASGGQDYVTKPFHAGELLSRIRTHIELKESRQELQHMNEILEVKVKERTKELEEANKKLEKANHELEKLDEAKVDFLRLISHEINTPLNGIIGFAGILKDMLTSTEYFELIDYLNISALRLNEFAQTSLLITSLRTSPEKNKKTSINLNEIVANVIDEQKKDVQQKNITVSFESTHTNSAIIGNEALIKTCIMHLLKNAIHYSASGMQIIVKCSTDSQGILLSIEDQGPGFTEVALDKLFKPFSPGEEHVDKNKGLGLTLVKMIVDFHQAKISISNKAEGGARVVLSFG